MKTKLFCIFTFLGNFYCSQLFAEQSTAPEIHCKHFIYGYPTAPPATNDLIIRDIYALSSNDETKFADWVAYSYY